MLLTLVIKHMQDFDNTKLWSSVADVKICSWLLSCYAVPQNIFRVSKGTMRGMSDSFGECYISYFSESCTFMRERL